MPTSARRTAPLVTLRRGDPCGRPRAGKSAKRRQWRMKQAGFEEVPRLAGTTVPGNRSAQRWAREPLPYAPSRTHCIGRTGSSAPTRNFVGADAYIGPPCRTPCKTPCHCEPVTDVTGVAIRPPSPCTRSREQLFSQYSLLVTSSLSCPLQYHKFLVVSILNSQVSCNYQLTSTRK